MRSTNDGGNRAEPNTWELLATYFRRPAVLLTILLSATAVLYSGTLSFEFVWDDAAQIVNNPLIRSWHNLSRAFVSDLWYHTARQQVYYRPLFVVWSMLNYAVMGLRPWGWHLGAILLHLGATLAVFWLARRLGLEYWTAALATLIFALHPVHIECVAWISAASDSMVTLLTVLAFVAFLNASDRDGSRRLRWRAASLIFLACALLTKEMAVTFPILVGLYTWMHPDRGQTRRSQKLRQSIVSMIPYAAVTLCYAMVRTLVLRNDPLRFDVQHGYADMVLTLPYVLYFYLRQLLSPLGLTGLYYTPYVTTQILARFALPLLLLLVLAALIYYWARRTGDWLVAFAGLWLLIGLAPALYLRNFGNGDFVRDRYMYLPSVGFCILVAKGLRMLPPLKSWSASAVQGFAISALCCAYVVASIPQQAYWCSDFLVYLRGHHLYPDYSYAAIGLAREYSRRGADDQAIALVKDAVNQAKKQDDEGTYVLFALAEVNIAAGRKEDGRKALEHALQATPEYAQSETGMSSVAGLWGKLGDYDRATQFCHKALDSDPNLYSALYNCGNIELMAGHYSQAESLLRRALQASPQLAAPRHFLGRALLLEGRNTEAQPYLYQAVVIDPGIYDYHYWLGQSYEQSGDKADAQREYAAALQISHDREEARARLAALQGDIR
jgi:protein O-mannosyl-transferase